MYATPVNQGYISFENVCERHIYDDLNTSIDLLEVS